MSRRSWQDSASPPWWPQGEPWPPHEHGWRRRRTGFVRRLALAAGGLLILSAVGAHTLLTALLHRSGPSAGSGQLSVVVVAAAVIVLLLAAFFTVMRRFAYPLGDIVGAADRVAVGELSTRLAERGPRALRAVARAFNSMTSRLEQQERQRQQLMSDVAHELRTPLTILQARLEGIADGLYPGDDTQMQLLLSETRTLARLVDDVRTLANAESGRLSLHTEPTDLRALVDETTAALGAASPGRTIMVDVPALPITDVDPVRVREILTNLLSNALTHSAADAAVSVSATATADAVVVAVADRGVGIAPEDLPRVFERFFKSTSSDGSGLGLTIARNLARAHGGDVTAGSQLGYGTTFRLTLPRGPSTG